jgi:hypothetical protein
VNNDTNKKRTAKGICKCNSSEHLRTSHDKCPLNPKNITHHNNDSNVPPATNNLHNNLQNNTDNNFIHPSTSNYHFNRPIQNNTDSNFVHPSTSNYHFNRPIQNNPSNNYNMSYVSNSSDKTQYTNKLNKTKKNNKTVNFQDFKLFSYLFICF